MARMPALVDLMARLDGRRAETIDEIVRVLRAAGQMPPTRRGTAALPVDAQQAASVLIASMTGEPPASAARAVEVYRGLRPKRRGGMELGLPVLHEVADAETFGQAVETLLARGQELKRQCLAVLAVLYDPSLESPESLEQLMALHAIEIEVTICRPVPWAKLVARSMNERGMLVDDFTCEWTIDARRMMAGEYRAEMEASAHIDRRCESHITSKTIFALSALLAAPASSEEYHREVA